MPGVILENLVRRHLADGIHYTGVHEVDDIAAPDEVHQRDDHKPHQEGTAANDEGIFQADDIAEAENCCACIEFQYELGLVGHDLSPMHHGSGDGLAPGSERCNHEVVQTAYYTADKQGLGALSASFTVDQHLGGGGSLREGILSVHFLDEILPERNEEKNAEHASEQ